MEIEIISREFIKPSSPTPQNLRNYNLSLLDQFIPPFQLPIILYFPTHLHAYKSVEDFISESTKTLKQSLSKLLTRFYPFAGRLKDHFSSDCNDKGFLFVVSKVKSNLSEFLKKPDQKANCRLIPCQLGLSEPGDCVAMVQVNYFDCGGMAFGFVFSHKVADGITMCSFIKSWSLFANGGCTETVCPNYIAQNFFPHNGNMPPQLDRMKYMKIGKSKMRRYVFNSRAISTLKAKSGDIFRPSRVEVVSAFLWKCFMSVNKSTKKLHLVTQWVNLRRRTQPPFPDNCFGNWLRIATSTSNNEDESNDQFESNLVRKIRESINKFDDDLIMGMHGDDGFSRYCKNIEEDIKYLEVAEIFSVTSWCNFGLYNVDFGWGKPIWFNNCSLDGNASESPYLNKVWLIDTKKGDGVEAWLTLGEEYMKAFDDIEELRLLASIDPSPFDV